MKYKMETCNLVLFVPCSPQQQEQFFPEIPAFDKKKDLFYTVGYKASFSTPVPGFILRQVLVLCSKLRRWNIVWQSGFIIQEGIVETLVEMREEKGGNIIYFFAKL